MSGYNKGQNIERLLKQIQLENSQIQQALGDIEPLLREAKRLFQQIKGNIDKYKTGRNLWLGQLKDSRGRTFQQVADTAPPMLPPVLPAPTPNPLIPLTNYQRTLINNIREDAIELANLKSQLDTQIQLLLLQLDFISRGTEISELQLQALLERRSNIRDIQSAITAVRQRLEGNVILLANSLGLGF